MFGSGEVGLVWEAGLVWEWGVGSVWEWGGGFSLPTYLSLLESVARPRDLGRGRVLGDGHKGYVLGDEQLTNPDEIEVARHEEHRLRGADGCRHGREQGGEQPLFERLEPRVRLGLGLARLQLGQLGQFGQLGQLGQLGLAGEWYSVDDQSLSVFHSGIHLETHQRGNQGSSRGNQWELGWGDGVGGGVEGWGRAQARSCRGERQRLSLS